MFIEKSGNLGVEGSELGIKVAKSGASRITHQSKPSHLGISRCISLQASDMIHQNCCLPQEIFTARSYSHNLQLILSDPAAVTRTTMETQSPQAAPVATAPPSTSIAAIAVETPKESERKRKRKALSCYDCRRRKLKCDRVFPVCGRCKKGGVAATCTYDPRTVEGLREVSASSGSEDEAENGVRGSAIDWNRGESAAVTRLSSDDRERLNAQENRISELERRLAVLEGKQGNGDSNPHPHRYGQLREFRGSGEFKELDRLAGAHVKDPRGSALESMLLHGKGLKTQFYGASHPSSLLVHVSGYVFNRFDRSAKRWQLPQLKNFMREAIAQHPQVSRVSDDLRSLKARWKVPKESSFIVVGERYNLLDLLPDRNTTDHLVQLYLDTLEKLYRILHVPSFTNEYNTFWENPTRGRPEFLAIVLTMIAAVRCMSPRQPLVFTGMSSSARELAIKCIKAVEAWLRQQSYKNTCLENYQVRCLLVIAKLTNAYKRKRMWTEASALLKFGIAQGLHRDPSLLGGPVSRNKKTPVFEQEMRRRLWFTMLELELQTSVDRGMAPSSYTLPYDTPPPSNINDDEFDHSTQQLPASKPLHEPTDASFLCVAERSLALRISLTAMVNDLSDIRYEDALAYGERIMQSIEALPLWPDSNSSELRRMILEVQLRQYLILLYGPFARQSEQKSQSSYAIMTCFNAAGNIVEQHAKLVSKGNFALALLRFDVYGAALALSMNTMTSKLVHSEFFSRTKGSGEGMVRIEC